MNQFSITELDKLLISSFGSIKKRIPEFNKAKVKSFLIENNITELSIEKIPQNFLLYFALMDALADDVLENKKIIDYGCGLGVLEGQALGLGMKPIGIDIFSEYNNKCFDIAKNILINFNISNNVIENILQYADASSLKESKFENFDFSISIGMLEHIGDSNLRQRIVQNMIKVLRNNGYMFLICGPNKFFPFDLHHYGPKFLFYHCLPNNIKKYYLKFFGKPEFGTDPTWLNGLKIKDIIKYIKEENPNAEILQAFPLFLTNINSRRWLNNKIINYLVKKVARIFTFLKIEPIIFIIAKKTA